MSSNMIVWIQNYEFSKRHATEKKPGLNIVNSLILKRMNVSDSSLEKRRGKPISIDNYLLNEECIQKYVREQIYL